MKQRVFRVLNILLVLMLVTSVVQAADASITIDTVGGKQVVNGKVNGTLSGKVLVQGTAMVSTPDDTPPPPKPLVADAGDSGFAPAGVQIPLLGTGYGGSEPYIFAWSSPMGTIEAADAPTAQLLTEGLAAGVYEVTLTVTDSAGVTAADTVKVVVFDPQQQTLLDEARLDPTPGVVGVGVPGTLKFPFDVPPNTTHIAIHAEWTVPTNDYDLRVLDPDGNQVASAGEFILHPYEDTGVAYPVSGRWTAVVDKFATVSDTVRVVVTANLGPSDPRPSVEAGGPYRFLIGAPQTLSAQVSGGTAPLTVGWDTDQDGLLDQMGAAITTNFPEGRHLVTFKATDAAGFERREMVSVLVADQQRLAAETSPITVIAINDTGINPYHLEFSALTYPDPDVLTLTRNFTRHPSEYIPGYPATAKALPITLGQGYFPAADAPIWTPDFINAGELYWIPGTKIIGAIEAGGSTGVTSGDDAHPILDDNGHGSGSASVSTGNRYGYCPTCLLLVVEALDESVAAQFSWVDISSNSFGYVAGAPLGLLFGPNEATRQAVERGQTVLFAAGNGVGNAFDVPISTYGSDQTGPDWNITVGAIRRDNERGIVGDGIPVHISAWGDGNLPSACRTGTVSQCAFGGTSAATPYTAGIFGNVLTEIRWQIGDGTVGQKPGQVVANGFPIANSPFLNDGKMTRAELREAILKTAFPLNQDNDPSGLPYVYPLTAPYNDNTDVLFEGYGAATPNGARRAIEVLLGKIPLPERPFEDSFFTIDRQIRDTLYGGYDRDGDGNRDYEGLSNLLIDLAAVETPEATMVTMRKVAALYAPLIPDNQALGMNALRFYLHRAFEAEPDTPVSCMAGVNVQYMDFSDNPGDLEPCFDNRITSVVAAFRPVAIFPSSVDLDAPLPAGSTVYVELYMTGETPSVIQPTGVLMAGDREIGKGSATPAPVVGTGPGGAACGTLGEACWTKYTFSFDTTRPAIAGDQLTFQVLLLGARSWAFGHEGAHASRITIVAAPLPPTGLDFGVTITSPVEGEEVPNGEVVAMGAATFPDLGNSEAGDHPTLKRVEVSVDDPNFGTPIKATLSDDYTAWSAPLGRLSSDSHTVYARASIDTTYSPVASSTFTISQLSGDERVEWQVVASGVDPNPDYWRPANGILQYSFEVNTQVYGKGTFDLYVRLLEGDVQTAINSVRVKFSGK
ncbi:MAG: hypothetical protein CVU41_15185 [Chloroflexi bacterium HGW-Chloroflexi-3]|nr:MAG: hypothetical protein CVU41_15185 [Chloroflexi bacterium HGW-Chloroflexi-3]